MPTHPQMGASLTGPRHRSEPDLSSRNSSPEKDQSEQ